MFQTLAPQRFFYLYHEAKHGKSSISFVDQWPIQPIKIIPRVREVWRLQISCWNVPELKRMFTRLLIAKVVGLHPNPQPLHHFLATHLREVEAVKDVAWGVKRISNAIDKSGFTESSSSWNWNKTGRIFNELLSIAAQWVWVPTLKDCSRFRVLRAIRRNMARFCGACPSTNTAIIFFKKLHQVQCRPFSILMETDSLPQFAGITFPNLSNKIEPHRVVLFRIQFHAPWQHTLESYCNHLDEI